MFLSTKKRNAGIYPQFLVVPFLCAMLIAGCGGSNGGSDTIVSAPSVETNPTPLAVVAGTDSNSISSSLLSNNPAGPGGAPNQSLRAGDVLRGDAGDDVLIGGLGIDVLFGYEGNDVLVGGTEDFNSNVDGDGRNSDNRDRAFGGSGDDVFIWAPGDGSDFFDGGVGTDVVIFGVLGELRDVDGSTNGAPFFNVNPPNTAGAQDFDGIFLQQDTNLPITRVSGSPGFCTVLAANGPEFSELELDHIVRFSLRSIANGFDAGERNDDDGLRVAVSLRNTEFLVCTKRDIVDGGGTDNIQILDLRNYPPTEALITDLPVSVQAQIE